MLVVRVFNGLGEKGWDMVSSQPGSCCTFGGAGTGGGGTLERLRTASFRILFLILKTGLKRNDMFFRSKPVDGRHSLVEQGSPQRIPGQEGPAPPKPQPAKPRRRSHSRRSHSRQSHSQRSRCVCRQGHVAVGEAQSGNCASFGRASNCCGGCRPFIQ